MPEQRPKILIVGIDQPVMSAIGAALSTEGYEVCNMPPHVTDIESTVAKSKPDLVILDLGKAARPDGYRIARLLRQASDVPLFVLSTAEGLEQRLEGFNAGADDYLSRPFAKLELLARTRALLRRSGKRLRSTWAIGDLTIEDSCRAVTRAGEAIQLTKTEYALLRVFAEHQGQVLSKEQVLTLVWGFDDYDINLVEVHISGLRRKLEAKGPRIVHTVRGVGYVLRP